MWMSALFRHRHLLAGTRWAARNSPHKQPPRDLERHRHGLHRRNGALVCLFIGTDVGPHSVSNLCEVFVLFCLILRCCICTMKSAYRNRQLGALYC